MSEHHRDSSPPLLDLCVVVRVALDGVTGAAESKAIQLDSVLDDYIGLVPGDPMRLQQVVSNLLTNAIEVTPTGGRVSVTVDTANEWARVRAASRGLGKGSIFTVVLPLSKLDEEEAVTFSKRNGIARDESRFDGIKELPVLVVDDDVATIASAQ